MNRDEMLDRTRKRSEPWDVMSPELAKQLHPDLPHIAAEIAWATREEMACTVEDVLARRTRALFLNAHAAVAMAPAVATLLAQELGKDLAWADTQVKIFTMPAAQYTLEKTVKEKPAAATAHTAA